MRLAQDRPTTDRVLPLVRALYERPDGATGCCLHVILDDHNVADGHVDFCIDYARERGHADCLELAVLLRQMSKTQRGRLANHKYG